MAKSRLIGEYPVIGIRPTIDGRRGPLKVRESLEEQTMGMAQAAKQSMAKAHYLAKELCKIPGVEMVNSGEYFHEFVTTLPKTEEVMQALENADILGGLPVEGGVLWCTTEKISKAELDKTVAIVKEVLGA